MLFDVDGTLVSTHGIPRKAMGKVLQSRYGNFNYDEYYNFSGRTDWQIVEHLLEFDGRKFESNTVKKILNEFTKRLEEELQNGKPPLIYPGVKDLLLCLSKLDNVYLGLVTGNIAEGARIKLSKAGLYEYFPVGAFGDDSADRNDLPPIAIERSEKYYKIKFAKENTWIIGDSIYDIICAQKNGLRSLAVCTGWTERDALEKSQPEFIENNFSNVQNILNILLE